MNRAFAPRQKKVVFGLCLGTIATHFPLDYRVGTEKKTASELSPEK
jgi:hypothetical protein